MTKKITTVAVLMTLLLPSCIKCNSNNHNVDYSECHTMEEYIEMVKRNDPNQYKTLMRVYPITENNLILKNPQMMAGITMSKVKYKVGEEVDAHLYLIVHSDDMRYEDSHFKPIENGHISYKATHAGVDTIKANVIIRKDSGVEISYPLVQKITIEE
ncbi:MAG: hypothetical protein MJZ30_01830 [Paludibacteraceae bacterium]|nr:hypothetical protein [Paludibacteraceae bacterium]